MSEEEKKVKKDLTDFFDSMPNVTNPVFFSNDKYIGIEVQVSRKGWGFGAITLSHNIQDGTWHLDDECTSKETVIEFLREAVPQIVEALYQKGNVKIDPPKYDEDET